jgi:hypothetical protein
MEHVEAESMHHGWFKSLIFIVTVLVLQTISIHIGAMGSRSVDISTVGTAHAVVFPGFQD